MVLLGVLSLILGKGQKEWESRTIRRTTAQTVEIVTLICTSGRYCSAVCFSTDLPKRPNSYQLSSTESNT
eukprot:scaffold45354_cov229-Amphora_coffeaeformis.AAC.1